MSELTFLRLVPDRLALAKWAARQKQPRDVDDTGFAWHGLLKAAFGDAAPKPFVDRLDAGVNELLAYGEKCEPLAQVEPLAAQAAGLATLRSTPMPETWKTGRNLSFEVRARPVVRSRQAGRNLSPVELDAAVAARRHDPKALREDVYQQWLSRELARDDAADLVSMRIAGFSRTRVARRHGQETPRQWSSVEGPDVWFRGTLRINDAEAFRALLGRGIGRHRSFGFGCLLVAPAGVLE